MHLLKSFQAVVVYPSVQSLKSSKVLTCKRCGNKKTECHNELFGPMLVHKVLTLCQNKASEETQLEDINCDDIFFDKYNFLFCFHCFKKVGKYDNKDYYHLPLCIINGSLALAKKLVRHQQIL